MARASRKPGSSVPRRTAGRRSIAAAKPTRSSKVATPKKKTTRAKVARTKKASAKKGKAAKKGAKTRAQAPVKKTVPKEKAPVKAKAPAAPVPPMKKVKPEVTPREIRKIRASLEQQRAVLLKEYSDLEEGSMISQSEASGEASFDEEFADAGSHTFEREKEMSIGQNIRDLVDKVNHAIEAIDRGRYGICERCGNPIAKARVMALPYATLCMTCKQQEERMR